MKTNNKNNKISSYFLLFTSSFLLLSMISFVIYFFTYSNNIELKKTYNEKITISKDIERNKVFNIKDNNEYLVDFDYFFKEKNIQKERRINTLDIIKEDTSYLNEMINNSLFFIKKELNTDTFIVTDLNGNIASFYKYSKNKAGYLEIKNNDD